MTERSYFWDGISNGDASEAPYGAEAYAKLLSILFASQKSFLFDYASISAYGGMVVHVQSVWAFVQGYYYEAVGSVPQILLTVPPNTSGLPRLDRVVIRINKLTQEGVMVIKQGTPAIAPAPPGLSTDPDILEYSLARIYVPSGVAALLGEYIHYEYNVYKINRGGTGYSQPLNENLMPNSEFMAGVGTAYDGAPAMWSALNNATFELADKMPQASRGSSVKVTCPATNDGIAVTVPNFKPLGISYHIKFLLNVISGEISIDIGGSIAALTPPTPGTLEFRFTNITPTDVTLSIYNSGATPAVFELGQVVISFGDNEVDYLPKKETILFTTPHTQTGYNDASINNGTYEVPLEDPIQGGVSALISRLETLGGNSALAATCFAVLQDTDNLASHIRVESAAHFSNSYKSVQGITNVPFTSAGEQHIQLQVSTDAASSMQIGIYHLGIRT